MPEEAGAGTMAGRRELQGEGETPRTKLNLWVVVMTYQYDL